MVKKKMFDEKKTTIYLIFIIFLITFVRFKNQKS